MFNCDISPRDNTTNEAGIYSTKYLKACLMSVLIIGK